MVKAANLIKVSRPVIIKEIEAGQLKHRTISTLCRIAFEDLVEYMNIMQPKQQSALDRITDNTRELDLDY